MSVLLTTVRRPDESRHNTENLPCGILEKLNLPVNLIGREEVGQVDVTPRVTGKGVSGLVVVTHLRGEGQVVDAVAVG